ncbi:MAG: hypothetical protein HZA53_05195 [Planctomycetes bacterium]|nr:hypothetical protein [Planctomycetota bacterium]
MRPRVLPLALLLAAPSVANAQTSAGPWTKLADPPIPHRYSTFVASHGSRALLFAGSDVKDGSGGERTDGALLDVATRAWTKLAECPAPPRDAPTIVKGGRFVVYAAGRDRWDEPDASGAVLDLAANTWRALPAWPVAPRLQPATASDDARVVFFGGHTAKEELVNGARAYRMTPLADGAVLDLATLRFEKLPPAPIAPSAGATLALVGSTLLVFGGHGWRDGFGITEPYDDAALYDFEKRAWTKLPPTGLSAGDAGFARAVGERWLVFGRKSYGGWEANAALFDPSTRTFASVGGLERVLLGVSFVGTHVHAGRALVMSTRQDHEGYLHGAWTWSAREDGWRELDLAATKVEPRMAPGFAAEGRYAAVVCGNREISMGLAPGKKGGAGGLDAGAEPPTGVPYYRDGLLFDLERDTVRALPASPLAARARPATVWVGGKLLVALGYAHRVGGKDRFTDAALFDPGK